MKNKSNIVINGPFKENKSRRIIKIIIIISILFSGVYLWGQDPVNINIRAIIDNNPVSIRIFAPTIVKKGEPFIITVEIWDFCERLVCGYNGLIEFSSTDNNAILPSKYKFIPSSINQGLIEAYKIPFGDHGIKRFQVILNTEGIQYIIVKDQEGLIGWSNPVVVLNETPKVKVYWGDIHGHSIYCDGSGWSNEVFYYAKNVACLDFAALTPHDHFVRDPFSSYFWTINWELFKNIVNSWNKAGEFVTLLSYEYRGELLDLDNSVGDMCVYTKLNDIPFYSGALEETSTPDKLFQKLKEWEEYHNLTNSILCIPHHPPHTLDGMTFDWSYYNPRYIRLVEIYSVHGSSEMSVSDGNRFPLLGGARTPHNVEINKTGYYVKDALSMGYHIGFMASGDSHDGHLGHSISHTAANHLLQPPISWKAFPHLFRCHHHYPNGLVAVYSPPNLTRENIFNSLWSRSCYAVKGISRPFINFTINGYPIGYNCSIIKVANKTTPRYIKLIVAAGGGTNNSITEIQIIKNNKIWKKLFLNNKTAILSWIDNSEIIGMNYTTKIDDKTYTNGLIKSDGQYYITDTADIPSDPSNLSTNGSDVYYAKIYEKEGGVAWAGPIWIVPKY